MFLTVQSKFISSYGVLPYNYCLMIASPSVACPIMIFPRVTYPKVTCPSLTCTRPSYP